VSTSDLYPVIVGRHNGFGSNSGKPVVVIMEPDECINPGTGFGSATHPGSRHIGFGAGSGKPLLAVGWACCDSISNSYVESTCWNVGIGPGITTLGYMYVYDLFSCLSANKQRCLMTYSAGTWTGSISLKGGTVNFAVTCDPGQAIGSLTKFKLVISGCDTTTVFAGYGCEDPLVINFGNINLPDCCDCPAPDSAATAGINVIFVANCRKVAMARHISSTAGGIPIVAKERNCSWDISPSFSCSEMQCVLHATITGSGGCACLNQTFKFKSTSPGHWDGTTSATPMADCSGGFAGQCALACTDNGNGTMTFTLGVTCGASNTGTATPVTVSSDTIDVLDITTTVTMGGIGSECCNPGTFSIRIMR
jgi:hypothetical protein